MERAGTYEGQQNTSSPPPSTTAVRTAEYALGHTNVGPRAVTGSALKSNHHVVTAGGRHVA